MKFEQLAALTGGDLRHADTANMLFRGVSIDSRTINSGELFVAIRGVRNNGHEYISQAVSRGAAGCLIEYSFDNSETLPSTVGVVAVENTHNAMIRLAVQYRNSVEATFVGITGSNGKTTTKELTYQIVKAVEPHSFRSPGNLNNLFGAPLSLFAMPQGTKVAVMEMGISTPGEMSKLARLVRPDVVLITNVGASHLEFLHTVEDVARAKLELIADSNQKAPLIVNADDPVLLSEARKVRPGVITFGVKNDADYKPDAVEQTAANGTIVTIRGKRFNLSLIGEHQVYNLLAACAVVDTLGYRLSEIDTESIAFSTAPMRGQIIHAQQLTIFSDCYNANPDSMRAAFKAYFGLAASGRRVVVLGDMLELGAQSEQYHQEIGSVLAGYPVDFAVFVGNEAKIMKESFEQQSPKTPTTLFANAKEAASEISGIIQQNDLILVKASRGIGLEKVVGALQTAEECD